MFEQMGRWLVVVGIALALLGLAVWLFGRFAPSGRLLPGDIVIQRPNLTIYLPLATSVAVSLVLTALLWLAAHLRR